MSEVPLYLEEERERPESGLVYLICAMFGFDYLMCAIFGVPGSTQGYLAHEKLNPP